MFFRSLVSRLIIICICISVISIGAANPLAAQTINTQIRQVRLFELNSPDVGNDQGITFSSATQHLYLASKSESAINTLNVSVYNFAEDQLGVYTIPSAAAPVNIAFNNEAGTLLLLGHPEELLTISTDGSGLLQIESSQATDIAGWGLQNPQGMVYDSTEKQLLILDHNSTGSAETRIVQIRDNGDGFATLGVGDISIITLNEALFRNARGIAVHSTTNHILLLDPRANRLFEIDNAGQLIAEHDLSGVDLVNPNGMIMAPSGDSTDEVGKLSLYMTNNRNILELDLEVEESAQPIQAVHTATLVRLTHVSQFSSPSPDTSGVTYLPFSHRLFISDSEVNETVSGQTFFQGFNLFESSLSGSLLATGATIAYSEEPTGLSYNPNTGHLFISDDDNDDIYTVKLGADGQFGTSDDTITFRETRSFGSDDPEGVTYAPDLNAIFIVDGIDSEVYRIDPGPDGLFLGGDDVLSSFDTSGIGVSDPEGVAYNQGNGTLFIVGDPKTLVIETTVTGTLVDEHDISVASSELQKPAGLTYSPSSQNPSVNSLYVADRGQDNDSVPGSNDGKLFEFALGSSGGGANQPPVVNAGPDRTITLPDGVSFASTATDDGLINPLSTTWSTVSGSGTVTFTNVNVPNTHATFSTDGIYVLQLAADDGVSTVTDTVTITVNEAGTIPIGPIDVRVAASDDDAEEDLGGSVTLSSSDLEIGFDNTTQQTIGIRFNGINLPQGALINDAYIQFQADETDTSVASFSIQGEASPNAATFTSTTGDVSSRPKTSAAVSWSPPAWNTAGEAGLDQRTPNIASVIQEIVELGGWNIGNSLTIIITGTGERTAEAYDGSANGAPLLHIDYSVPILPEQVTLLSPNGAIPSGTPTFVWRPEASSTGYNLVVYDADNDMIVFMNATLYPASICTGSDPSTDTCSVQPSLTLPAGNYTWLVQASNGDGLGPWSGVSP